MGMRKLIFLSLLSLTTLAEVQTTISGLVELHGRYNKSQGTPSSDIVLDAVELGVNFKLSEKMSADTVFLFEEDAYNEDPDVGLILDQAYLTYAINDSLSVSAGKKVIAFGQMESRMMIEPLTMNLGEAYAGVAELSYDNGGLSATVYAFNGNVSNNTNQKNQVKDYGIDINYSVESDKFSWKVGASHISNIYESDTIDGYLAGESPALNDTLLSVSAGSTIYAKVNYGANELIVESMGAYDAFTASDVATEDKPSALQVEYTYSLSNSDISLGYQKGKKAKSIGLDKERRIFQYNMNLEEGTSVKFEYVKSEDFSKVGNELYTVGLMAEF
jgi:hypothetical protein